MTPPTSARVPQTIRVFLARLLITLLIIVLGLALYFSINPLALTAVLRTAPIPGSVAIPTPGPTPPLPAIAASPGPLPAGYQAYTGAFNGGRISCGFLLDLGDTLVQGAYLAYDAPVGAGARVGVTAAHASPRLAPGETAEFYDPGGNLAALLTGQIAFGQTFLDDQFTLDYVLWSVDPAVDPAHFLRPDLRSLAQPGEPVYLYAPLADGAGGPQRWPGVVVSAAAFRAPNGVPNAIWVQLEDTFSPAGYSGCPVVSRITGGLIGMAVAGADFPPVVIGLHPVASLVEKARAALLIPKSPLIPSK